MWSILDSWIHDTALYTWTGRAYVLAAWPHPAPGNNSEWESPVSFQFDDFDPILLASAHYSNINAASRKGLRVLRVYRCQGRQHLLWLHQLAQTLC
jgi:hypothetical protein